MYLNAERANTETFDEQHRPCYYDMTYLGYTYHKVGKNTTVYLGDSTKANAVVIAPCTGGNYKNTESSETDNKYKVATLIVSRELADLLISKDIGVYFKSGSYHDNVITPYVRTNILSGETKITPLHSLELYVEDKDFIRNQPLDHKYMSKNIIIKNGIRKCNTRQNSANSANGYLNTHKIGKNEYKVHFHQGRFDFKFKNEALADGWYFSAGDIVKVFGDLSEALQSAHYFEQHYTFEEVKDFLYNPVDDLRGNLDLAFEYLVIKNDDREGLRKAMLKRMLDRTSEIIRYNLAGDMFEAGLNPSVELTDRDEWELFQEKNFVPYYSNTAVDPKYIYQQR